MQVIYDLFSQRMHSILTGLPVQGNNVLLVDSSEYTNFTEMANSDILE